jgi:predicted Zn-dependent protease
LDELERFVDASLWVRDEPQTALALAQALFLVDRTDEAVPLLEFAAEAPDFAPDAKLLLAQMRYDAIQQRLRSEFIPEIGLDDDVKAELEACAELVQDAIERQGEGERGSRFLDALAGSAGIKVLLGEEDEARAALTDVLSANPEHPIALRNMGLLSIRDTPEKAVGLLQKAAVHFPDDHVLRLAQANALTRSGDPDKAIQHLRQLGEFEGNAEL